MTQKISELVDGELEGHEAAGAYGALQSGGEARDAWFRYHLISDAIHDTRLLSQGFSQRVAERLAQEPTVLAPVVRMPARGLPRYAAMAAGLAAIAFVGGITFKFMGESPAPQVAKAPEAVAPAVAAAEPTEAARDYMLAHQGYSPRNALQGYVRTVSAKAPNKP
jgi:sigma-E factor negative regulatory protein RseA